LGSDILAGAGYGLVTACLLILLVLLRLPEMGASYDVGSMLQDVMQPLLAYGLAGGALVGPLRPFMRTTPGAGFVGAVTGGLVGIAMQIVPSGWGNYKNWFTLYVAVLAGSVFAFRRWRHQRGGSQRSA
jgi:hypothetical protein